MIHEISVEPFPGRNQKDGRYLRMLRYTRISNADPEKVIVSRPGQHPRLISVANAMTAETTPSEMETPDGVGKLVANDNRS